MPQPSACPAPHRRTTAQAQHRTEQAQHSAAQRSQGSSCRPTMSHSLGRDEEAAAPSQSGRRAGRRVHGERHADLAGVEHLQHLGHQLGCRGGGTRQVGISACSPSDSGVRQGKMPVCALHSLSPLSREPQLHLSSGSRPLSAQVHSTPTQRLWLLSCRQAAFGPPLSSPVSSAAGS